MMCAIVISNLGSYAHKMKLSVKLVKIP